MNVAAADGESVEREPVADASPEPIQTSKRRRGNPHRWADEALASWLSALRGREGITISELAKRVRMPVSTVGSYLSGARYPGTRETLERLLEGLNADAREGHYAVGCWYDHQIGMAPASPPRIAPRIDEPIDTRTSWTTGRPQ
ncbi:helix-turn-helix domain-containing protein [Paractinoplanes globisporus]|uniref:Helix-turn-helix domain-containing protein n=1 Tax=Paractinoplanes globisporus TaxID=113565 RepID=A0ABW6W9W7_9ACTN|nr:helix-turn-helix transcriptional regulator [Actinoplanes globisporus]